MPSGLSLLVAATALSAGSQIYGAVSQSNALDAQAEAQKQQYEANAKYADLQAEDALARGEKTASRIRDKVRQTIGAERSSYAAQGVDVNSGSAAAVQSDTAAQGAMDILTARNNAWREAHGYKIEATGMRTSGQYAYTAGKNAASNTLLTGGLGALGTLGMGAYKAFGATVPGNGVNPTITNHELAPGESFGWGGGLA